MLTACPHCGVPVVTERGAFCPTCGGQVLQPSRAPVPSPPSIDFPAHDETPILVTQRSGSRKYGRNRSRSSRTLALLTTLVVAGSSIGSTLIMLSVLSKREDQQKVIPAVAEIPNERIPIRPRPSVSVGATSERETAPRRSTSGKFAVPTDTQLQEEKNGLTRVGKFSASELLEQASTVTRHPVTRYLLYTMSIDKGVKEGNLPITMRAVDGIVAEWDIVDPDAYRREVQEKFAATKPAAPNLSQTVIDATKPSEAPSQPAAVDRQNTLILKGIAIDLTRKKTSIPITLSHVDVDDSRSLRVEVSSIAGATAQAFLPADRVAKLGSKLRIALRERPPQAGIQVSLSGIGKSIMQVQFEPIMIAFDGKEYDWTFDRAQAMHKQLDLLVAKQAAAIPSAEAAIKRATADWNSLLARYGDNTTAPQVVALKNDALARIERSKATLAQLQVNLPISRSRAQSAAELGELTTAVHDKAVVHFRLYYVTDGREIEIARTE